MAFDSFSELPLLFIMVNKNKKMSTFIHFSSLISKHKKTGYKPVPIKILSSEY